VLVEFAREEVLQLQQPLDAVPAPPPLQFWIVDLGLRIQELDLGLI
jgi:hypothetical protein